MRARRAAWVAVFAALGLAAAPAGSAAAAAGGAAALAGSGAVQPKGSLASDSLLMPMETFVLTREDLVQFNVHTLEDVLMLLPGVSWWREGPPAAGGGISIEGRGSRGVNLLLNGVPLVDPYRLQSLARFLPISRLERVEVVYSGSPGWSGDVSSRGFINIVMEEGGREAPTARLNFTYGGSKRRVRRAWFATPRAHVSAVIAYDEYLQDAAESMPSLPGRLLGQYDGRAVLGEILFEPSSGDRVLLRLRRYEDSYVGTAASSTEDVRYSGLASRLSYDRGGLTVSIDQQTLLLSRKNTRERSFTLAGRVRWSGSLGPVTLRAFGVAEDAEFENALRGVSFDSSYRRFEGGAVTGGKLPTGVTWRLGAWGGSHEDVGTYAGGELAIAKTWNRFLTQDLVIARRLRLPAAQELYQPEITLIAGGDTLSVAGNPDLAPEVADEISLGFRVPRLSFSFFGRDESSVIYLEGEREAVYRSEGSGAVTGARARFDASTRIAGFDCRLGVAAEGFRDRESLSSGVPQYRATGEIALTRRVFQSERLTIAFFSEAAGERLWPGAVLPPYYVHHLRAMLTVMSARLSFEIRNLLSDDFETVPGYNMSSRFYAIGIVWELLD